MESLWGNENGWGNVSEECCFSVFDVAAAMQTEHIVCTHIYSHTCIQAHTQECMTVNHGYDVCVSGFEDEEKGQRAPGDVAYPMDREKEKRAGEREELGTAHL